MPMRSKSQNAAMHAAASGHSTLGIPKSVGAKFVSDSHGQNVKALPKRAGGSSHKKSGDKPPRVFGSMAPR